MAAKPKDEQHGLSRTKIYRTWQNVKDRCSNPNNPAAHNYADRGITMHPPWMENFVTFKDAVGMPPTPKHTLERIKNDQGYVPGNVTWATRKEQAQNLRKNVNLTVNGRTQSMAVWAQEMGLHPSTISYRLNQGGMSHEEAVLTPRRGGRR